MATPSHTAIFDDIFHDNNDDQDVEHDLYIDFDDPYQTFIKEDQTEIIDYDSTMPTPANITQSIGQDTNDDTSNSTSSNVPKYLLYIHHKAFEDIFNPILQKITGHTLNIDDLRQMTMLTHRLAMANLNRSLWSTYLRSGTGKLKDDRLTYENIKYLNRPGPHIWSDELQAIIRADRRFINANGIQNDEFLSYDIHLNYVNQKLDQYKNEQLNCQLELNTLKQQHFNSTTSTKEIEDAIENFVENYGIVLHRLMTDKKIAAINYDYNDRLIEREFNCQSAYKPQIDLFRKLTQIKFDKEVARMKVALLKQRLTYNYFSDLFPSLQQSLIPSVTFEAIDDIAMRQHLIDRYAKILQHTKSNLILIHIRTAEIKMEEYQIKFDQLMDKMEHDRRIIHLRDDSLTDDMLDILHRRFKNFDERLLCLYNLKLKFFQHISRTDYLPLDHLHSSHLNQDKHCSPSFIQRDCILQQFNFEHRRFLDRGPTYVTPCQLHSSASSSSVQILQLLKQKIAPLRQQLTSFFNRYSFNFIRQMTFEKLIEQEFHQSFSVPIPKALEKRVLYEKQLIQSIRTIIKQNNLILRRTADDQNTFYLGSLDEFMQKTAEYLADSRTFEIVSPLDENPTEQQQQLIKIIRSIDSLYEQFLEKQLISQDHFEFLKIGHRSNIRLPSLYFLPEAYQGQHLLVRPRLSSCQHAPIQTLSIYLDKFLRPLFNKFSCSTTFTNGHDFIQLLQHYCLQQNIFLPNTTFYTFQIHNLSVRLAHNDILAALRRFLNHSAVKEQYDSTKYASETIERLTSVFLRSQLFTYQNHIYRYTKGCSLNFALSRLLFDIYLHDWQIPLVRQIRLNNQFYGRYHDTGFFTWLGSKDSLLGCLQELNEQYPDIQITTSTGSQVHFLQMNIENRQGHLFTSVYHDPYQQTFLLPYVTGHPRLIYRQWFQFALLRAALYCSTWDDFQDERLYTELTLIANGYSYDFVRDYLQQFFVRFNPSPSSIRRGVAAAERNSTVPNQETYQAFRTQIFRYFYQRKLDQEQQIDLEMRTKRKCRKFSFYYLYDWGNRCEFNRQFYQHWLETIETDPNYQKYGIKMKLSTQHCYSSNRLFLK